MTDPAPAEAAVEGWSVGAGRALRTVAAGLLTWPVGARVVAALGALVLPAVVADDAARVAWGRAVVSALVVPGLVGPALILLGAARLARAVRGAPRGDAPLFAFGPVLIGLVLVGRLVLVPVALLSEGAGPLLAGADVLGAIPAVVALLLGAATAARAGAGFVAWAAWAAAAGSLATDVLGLLGWVGDGPRLVAAGVVGAVAILAAEVVAAADVGPGADAEAP